MVMMNVIGQQLTQRYMCTCLDERKFMVHILDTLQVIYKILCEGDAACTHIG
jgi:hypothetical protein